jgi:hypothetical protein
VLSKETAVNVQLLIDAIVRQTTVLIAQLATTGGARAPLAQVAQRVFLELADELAVQGVSRKVSADMFGMALRTYLRTIQRYRESSTDQGQSLWEAVLDYLGKGDLVSRAEVFVRFHRDDPGLVRGVLHDLSESGLVLRVGSGAKMAYRAASTEELRRLAGGRRARRPAATSVLRGALPRLHRPPLRDAADYVRCCSGKPSRRIDTAAAPAGGMCRFRASVSQRCVGRKRRGETRL